MSAPSFAENAAPFSRQLVITHQLQADQSLRTEVTETIKVLSGVGVKALGRIELAKRYPGGAPDGVRGHILRSDGILVELAPVSQDQSGTLPPLQMPELYPDDVITLKTEQTSPNKGWPGVALMHAFPDSGRFESVKVTLTGKTLTHIQHETRGFDIARHNQGAQDHLVFTMKPVPHRAEEPDSTHMLDQAPRIALSSYANFETMGQVIAQAYALPETAHPTMITYADQVVQSQQIAQGHQHETDEARALLRHVVDTTRADMVLLSRTSPTPLSPVAILEQRRGTHFEVANLYRALLAARGIASDLVLTNLRPVYSMPKIPVLGYDTALVFIPSLGVYADPAANVLSFGALRPEFGGKFFLKIGKAITQSGFLPFQSIAQNRVVVRSEMSVNVDGTLDGQTRTEGYGASGIALRQFLAAMAPGGNVQAARMLLVRQNLEGNVHVSAADPLAAADPFVVDLSFTLAGDKGKDGGIRIPLGAGPRLVRPPQASVITALREEKQRDFPCWPQNHSYDLVLHLPYTSIPYAVPADVIVKVAHASYEARYVLTGDMLTIKRNFTLQVPGGVCTSETAKDLAPAIRAAARDMARKLTIRGEDD